MNFKFKYMQSKLDAKMNLLKELKWNLRQPNVREKMTTSFVLTPFLLSQIGILTLDVTDREATIEEAVTHLFNHSDWVIKKF